MRRLLPLLLAAAASAAEVARRDLQLALEAGDGGYSYELGTPIGDFAGDDAFDRFAVLRLGGRWAFAAAGSSLAPLVGADLELLDAPGTGGGLSGEGLALAAGATWAATGSLAGDLEGFAALHQSAIDIADAGLAGDGTLWRAGLRGRLLWHPVRRWSLGLEAGWTAWSADLACDGDRPLVLDGSTFTAGLVLAWRPSARPGGVE